MQTTRRHTVTFALAAPDGYAPCTKCGQLCDYHDWACGTCPGKEAPAGNEDRSRLTSAFGAGVGDAIIPAPADDHQRRHSAA